MSSRNKARRHRPAPLSSPSAGRRQPPRGSPAPAAPPGRITESYAPPAPRDLPELRGQLAQWLAGEGPGFYLTMALAGCQWIPPGSTSVTAGAAQIARQEHQRVTTADLYWVSAPMTALARHAAARLPTRALHPHDLPSRTGFMVFEAPLATYVNDEGREVQIVAVSWGPWGGPGGRWGSGWWDQGGIWLSFFSHPAPVLPREAFTGGTADRAAMAPLMCTVPPALPDNEAGWPFGDLPGDQEIPEGTTAAWALVTRAAWRLMRQPLAAETTERADRAARRRLARAGQPDTGVRVIHIRRAERGQPPSGTAGGTREYGVQWWVGGHWRTYWCGPGRTRPEDRWIDPYLAGPEDKPVRGTERVQVWDR
ncbi:MAG TPA: hypothetical protein VMU94_10660 [Streptosporangiaceae bacterium]|nr:hypothetical protein [Streptosporangiaceae bacterium]